MTNENRLTVASEVQPLLIESGFPHSLTVDNRFHAMMSLGLHAVILSRKAELDQFLLGLSPLVESIRKHPDLMEPLFVAGSSKPTTADDLELLIEFDGVDDNIKEYFSRYIRLEGNSYSTRYIRLEGNSYSTRHKDKFALLCGQIFLNNYINITATQLISM